MIDVFPDARESGKVIGTTTATGHKRFGTDCEGIISIDHAAIRIGSLIEAGFGRAAISYGPFEAQPGLAFCVSILNGHNTAQAEPLPDSFGLRMRQWLAGAGNESKARRLRKWVFSGRVRRSLRQFRWWRHVAGQGNQAFRLDENLAVGWFEKESEPDPIRNGCAFVMHALGAENGELSTGDRNGRARRVRGVQNLPLYLISILRPSGAIFYVSSLSGAAGLSGYPEMRPVGFGRVPVGNELYVGIHQGVSGQIGFRIDTRIYGTKVATVDGYEQWNSGAVFADSLIGDGNIHGSVSERGGVWTVLEGSAERSKKGFISTASRTLAITSRADFGLISAIVTAPPTDGKIAVLWRLQDTSNYCFVEFGAGTCEIALMQNGIRKNLASRSIRIGGGARVEVLDFGGFAQVQVDGETIAERPVKLEKVGATGGIGLLVAGSGGVASFSHLEGHARELPVPEELRLPPPWFKRGDRVMIHDAFQGEKGHLADRKLATGGVTWSRLLGAGTIAVTENAAARVEGTLERPCPGRTAYGVNWPNPGFADVEVEITPPGTARGQKHHCSSGLILFQDPDNYVICNFWMSDSYAGSSVSTFFRFDGYEDLYDAVWTNVGDRVFPGKPTRLRLCCDGEKYLVFLNNEPVLYRAFTDVYADCKPLRIQKVGLVANWEWGFDTGTVFRNFIGRE
jgi:hypothetical protein